MERPKIKTYPPKTPARKEKTYQQGVEDGRALERQFRTKTHLNNLMLTQHMTIDEAMQALILPNAERAVFRKIFANIAAQKAKAKQEKAAKAAAEPPKEDA